MREGGEKDRERGSRAKPGIQLVYYNIYIGIKRMQNKFNCKMGG